MIRAIVVQRTSHKSHLTEGWFRTRGRYLIYTGKSGNPVITTEKGMAIPLATRRNIKYLEAHEVNYLPSLDSKEMESLFIPETDLHDSQARDGKGFRIKYFDSYKDLYKHADINTKSGVPRKVSPFTGLYADVNKHFGSWKVKKTDPLALESYTSDYSLVDYKLVDELSRHFDDLGGYIKQLAKKYPDISLADIATITYKAFSIYVLETGRYGVNPYKAHIAMHPKPTVMYPKDGSKGADKSNGWTPSPEDLPFPFGFPPLDAGQKDTHDITKIIRSLGKKTKF